MIDLPTGRYWYFCEPNNKHLIIHTKSINPPTILKHLPNAICSRLCSTSSDSQAFNKAKPIPEEALKNSGHHYNTEYSALQRKLTLFEVCKDYLCAKCEWFLLTKSVAFASTPPSISLPDIWTSPDDTATINLSSEL